MTEGLLTELKKKILQKAKSDNADFSVYDYSGGNFDDAYYMGIDDGEITYARFLLAKFFPQE